MKNYPKVISVMTAESFLSPRSLSLFAISLFRQLQSSHKRGFAVYS